MLQRFNAAQILQFNNCLINILFKSIISHWPQIFKDIIFCNAVTFSNIIKFEKTLHFLFFDNLCDALTLAESPFLQCYLFLL
jgi:hypothetical protein